MKILTLTRLNTEIQFSINELVIIRNSLMEIYRQFKSIDFEERIRGLSREAFFELAKTFHDLTESSQESIKSTLNNDFFQVNQVFENQIYLKLTYQEVLSICSALNEICNGIDLQDFQEKIESKKETVSTLLNTMHLEVVQRMQENTPENLIYKKKKEISKELNFSRDNLRSELPLPIFIRICQLKFKSHILIFRFSSFKNRTIFSNIQIAFGEILASFDSFAKSDLQFVRNNDLLSLIAYLELTADSVINNEDLTDFKLSIYNSKGSICFEIQVLPKTDISKEKENLKIRLNLPLRSLEDKDLINILEIEDVVAVNDINFFTQTIRGFLTELLLKDKT